MVTKKLPEHNRFFTVSILQLKCSQKISEKIEIFQW